MGEMGLRTSAQDLAQCQTQLWILNLFIKQKHTHQMIKQKSDSSRRNTRYFANISNETKTHFTATHEENLFQHLKRGHVRTPFFQSCSLCISAELHALLLFHSSSPFILYSIPPIPLPTPHSVCCLGALTLHCLVLRAYWASLRITLHQTPLYLVCCVCACVSKKQRVKQHNCACMCKLRGSICVQER